MENYCEEVQYQRWIWYENYDSMKEELEGEIEKLSIINSDLEDEIEELKKEVKRLKGEKEDEDI